MNRNKLGVMPMVAVFAFALGLGFNGAAFSDAIHQGNVRIAVVDVNKVVNNSAQVRALKKQQEQKKEELTKWLAVVKADIQKQSTPQNKEKLVKKYDAELAKRQQANNSEYAKRISEIDANISKIIGETASAEGYTVVLSKSSVLYGGDDLTQEISRAVR